MFNYDCILGVNNDNQDLDCIRNYHFNDCEKAIFEAIDSQLSKISPTQEYFDRIDALPDEIKGKYHIARVQKIGGKIYLKHYGISDWHIDTKISHFLQRLKENNQIDNVDIVASLYDEMHHTTPEYDKIFYSGPVLVANYNKDDLFLYGNGNNFVLFPDAHSVPKSKMAKHEHMFNDKEKYPSKIEFLKTNHNLTAFDTKIDKAIFTARANINPEINKMSVDHINKHPRLKLPFMSFLFPDHLEVNVELHTEKDKEESKKLTRLYSDLSINTSFKNVPTKEQVKYKYIISADGNGASWTRPLAICFSDSLLLYQTEEFQWFQPALQPFVHYLPIKKDLSDLIERIDWARANSDKVKEIIKNQNEVARKCFHPQTIAKQLSYIIENYAKKFNYKIKNKNFPSFKA